MRSYDEYRASEHEASLKNMRRIMKQISRYLPAFWVKQINDFIEESGYCFDFEIVRSVEGHDKVNHGYRFKVFVDQYCDGGFVGDDFAGSVCIPIKNGNYLKFKYEM